MGNRQRVFVCLVLVAIGAFNAQASVALLPISIDETPTATSSSCYNQSNDTSYAYADYQCSGCTGLDFNATIAAATAPYSWSECARNALKQVGGSGNNSWPANSTTCDLSTCTETRLKQIFCMEYGRTCNFTGSQRYTSYYDCLNSVGVASDSDGNDGTFFCQDKHLWFARTTAEGVGSGPHFHCPHAGGFSVCVLSEASIVFNITAATSAQYSTIYANFTGSDTVQTANTDALFQEIVSLQTANSGEQYLITNEGVRTADYIVWSAMGYNSSNVVQVTMDFWYYDSPILQELYGMAASYAYLNRTVANVYPGATYSYISSNTNVPQPPPMVPTGADSGASSCYKTSNDTSYTTCSANYLSCSGCLAANIWNQTCDAFFAPSYYPYTYGECVRNVLKDVGSGGTYTAGTDTCDVSRCDLNHSKDIFCTDYGATCNFTGAANQRFESYADCRAKIGNQASAAGGNLGGFFCQDKHLWFARTTPEGSGSGPHYHCPHAGGFSVCVMSQANVQFYLTVGGGSAKKIDTAAATQQNIIDSIGSSATQLALYNAILAAQPSTYSTQLQSEGVRSYKDITWAAAANGTTGVTVTMSFWYYDAIVPHDMVSASTVSTTGFIATAITAVASQLPGVTYSGGVPSAPTAGAPSAPSTSPNVPAPPAQTKSASTTRSVSVVLMTLVTLLSFVFAK